MAGDPTVKGVAVVICAAVFPAIQDSDGRTFAALGSPSIIFMMAGKRRRRCKTTVDEPFAPSMRIRTRSTFARVMN